MLPFHRNRELSDIAIPGRSITDDVQTFVNTVAENTMIYYNNGYFPIDDRYSKIDYVPGLSTTLFPHQKTIVKALLDIEEFRQYNNKDKTITLTNNCCVLSEPVGSGKTIEILALILLNRVPKAYKNIQPVFIDKILVGHIGIKYKHIIKSTLIFVASSVLSQWERAISTFTSLSCFKVSDVRDLRALFALIQNNEIGKFDIVLVKNGVITVPVELPFTGDICYPNTKVTSSIYNIIGSIKNICWARVVIDDFDTIKLPKKLRIIPAWFTIYVSSTRAHTQPTNYSYWSYNNSLDFLVGK
jgi:SNF2 family DNA or RNA helicase